MKEAVMKVIDTLTQEDFHGAFQKLLERYNKHIAAGGEYFEGDIEFHVYTINKCPYEKSLETYWRHVVLLAYCLSQETVAAIMMLDKKNTQVKVRSPDWDTDFFDIVADVLLGNTLAPYRVIICLVYVLRTSIDEMKQNSFTLKKKKKGKKQTIFPTNYHELRLYRWHGASD